MQKEFDVLGMTCAACSARVEKCVAALPSARKVSVNLLTNRMKLEWDETQLQEQQILDAVEKAGYHALVRGAGATAMTANPVQVRMQQKKQALLISVLFLLPLLYLAMAPMLPRFLPGWMQRYFLGAENALVLVFAEIFCLLPILYYNREYFQVGFSSLLHRNPTMDTLIALGASASVGYSVVISLLLAYAMGHGDWAAVERYRQDIYFESAGTILTLITVGKYLEARAKGKTSAAIEKLMQFAPQTAWVWREGQEVEIPVEQVQKDDIFLVKPGSRIPVDGIVLEGFSGVDESAMTGESMPVAKQKGDKLLSATVNGTGFLKAQAVRVGAETAFQQVLRCVEEASSSKAPIAKIADKVSGIFVPVVMGIASLTLLGWLLAGASFSFALSMSISVLVISCPCALGLATPVAIMVGIGKGAEENIFIKSGEALETAHQVDTIVLDKTGTITTGHPQVTDFVMQGCDKIRLWQIAAALEKNSQHPLAEAVLQYSRTVLSAEAFQAAHAEHFSSFSGLGVQGIIAGEVFWAGNLRLMEQQGIVLSEEIQKQLKLWGKQGKTPLLLANHAKVLGMIAVADREQEGSREAIQQLQQMGLEVIMLTGDYAQTAEAIRQRLGMATAFAEVLPQDKAQKIAALQQAGHKVAMVGDGINDAPALVQADVGMAIGAGTDIALESADMVFMKNDLRDIVSAIRLSRAVIRNIRQNLFWAFFYNSLGIPLAAGVLYPLWGIKLSPMIGAAAMSLSSFCVVSNALRLQWFHSWEKSEEKISAAEQDKAIVVEERELTEMETKVMMNIEGMMCGHCEMHVRKALDAIAGVTAQEVSHEKGIATVVLQGEVSDAVLQAAVEEEGYKVLQMKHEK